MENKQDILKKLGSSDIDLVSEAIEQIKTEGDLSIVPELLDILLQCKEPVIITHITSLLSDIKDSGFKTILMEKLFRLQIIPKNRIYYAYAGNRPLTFLNTWIYFWIFF